MQISGSKCTKCDEVIFLQAEGTWCLACAAPYHEDCFDGSGCLKCGAPLVRGQSQAVHSERCPECGVWMARYADKDACPKCGARTIFDSAEIYQERCASLKKHGLKLCVLGGLEMAVAAVGLLFAFGVITAVIGVVAIPDGVLRIRRGLRAMEFR